MEKQFLALFESAKKSADILATSASIFPEVYRCLDALDKLKRFPVTSSRVLVSTHVAKEVQYLTKHRVKMIRTAASCLLDTWARKLYARNSVIDGKAQPTKSRSGSRTGTLVVKIHGRVIGRVKVDNPIQTEKKIEEEKEKVVSVVSRKLHKNLPSAAQSQGKYKGIRRCFKKPSTKRIPEQENVKDFCSFKKPSEEPVRCSDGLRGKVRHILVESFSRVAREVKGELDGSGELA
ncbi:TRANSCRIPTION FACTOR S-II ZINC FINGER DOMAIN-CONTAINING PROTEIN [Salix koriyanagi]|uniref:TRANSCRIPTION FACTOR S-II ZINC FINGER DOMAIN-CONTAINING PROTEIN n=1 Tax=Salix koriyanagi TaxID=2511006 RepID=A0A9Q1APH0_9ROSI|nr:TRANSCRIPTION FACTOR S-II ZINC FINGER DOMAIN-CONTAINING PROTEIN [Salix koriyanagi]